MISLDHLPNELLSHILNFLDSPSPLHHKSHQDPLRIPRPVRESTRTPIKNASLVCHLWRRSILPLLFRHVQWCFRRLHRHSRIDLLEFLGRESVSHHVESLVLLVDVPNFRFADGQFWGVLPSHSTLSVSNTPQEHCWDNNWLWHAIFNVIDPVRVTLIGSPDIISSLLSRTVDLTSDWAFNNPRHIISLSRRPDTSRQLGNQETLVPSQKPDSAGTIPCDLFSIRRWTSLLINEGSFASVYSTYEFFHYSSPTLLPVIFNASDSSFSGICRSLQSLSYIATFPLSHHIADIVIPTCPRVEYLYVQLMPKNRDFWESETLSRVNLSDLWLECDASYSLLMRQLLVAGPDHGWDSLRLFETGDALADGAWNITAYNTQVSGVNGWCQDGESRLVRALSESTVDSFQVTD